MALHIPDHKYIEAKKIVDKLSDEGRDGLIKYYISEHKKWSDEDRKYLKEYQEVFDGIKKFTRF